MCEELWKLERDGILRVPDEFRDRLVVDSIFDQIPPSLAACESFYQDLCGHIEVITTLLRGECERLTRLYNLKAGRNCRAPRKMPSPKQEDCS